LGYVDLRLNAGIKPTEPQYYLLSPMMVHSDLRTCEIRRLHLGDLDLAARQVRIEQSKGLQDRMVFLSQTGIEALKAYLEIRGPAETDHVFIYRYQLLKVGYCGRRLRLYGERCGLHATPHQLRFSCATLLLNAGTPILTVQQILGHQRVETTLRYARLYDCTVVRDYGQAMVEAEGRGLSILYFKEVLRRGARPDLCI